MEKVLVAFHDRHISQGWEAMAHACSLAKRMHVQLNLLLVTGSGDKSYPMVGDSPTAHIKNRLQLLMETAQSEGITINFFITEGNYEDEVIKFVNHNKISLLVHETCEGDCGTAGGETDSALRTLRHRIGCKMEIVAPKKHTPKL
jgi:hypothetical protein